MCTVQVVRVVDLLVCVSFRMMLVRQYRLYPELLLYYVLKLTMLTFLITLIRVVEISAGYWCRLLGIFWLQCEMRSVVLHLSALHVLFLEPRRVFTWTNVVYVTLEWWRRFLECVYIGGFLKHLVEERTCTVQVIGVVDLLVCVSFCVMLVRRSPWLNL
jgi:hypothetical protein